MVNILKVGINKFKVQEAENSSRITFPEVLKKLLAEETNLIFESSRFRNSWSTSKELQEGKLMNPGNCYSEIPPLLSSLLT